MMRINMRMIRIAVFLTSVFTTVLAAEGLMRIEKQRNKIIETRGCRRQSQRYHHELVPNTICRSRYPEWDTTFRVNSLGFRDDEISREKPEGVFRILLIGDSFVEGEGVESEQIGANVLERQLSKKFEKSVEVVNMGVMSYSPIIYQRVIEDKGLPLDPDLVIVAVDMSDFQNDYSYAKDLDESGNFRNILFQQKMGQPHVVLPGVNAGIKFWLRSHSVLYSEVADRTKQLIRKMRHIPEPTIFKINDPASDPHFATRSEDNVHREEMWHPFGNSLIAINKLMEKAKVPWIAVTYPYGHQVRGDEWSKGRLKNGFESARVYLMTAADLLVSFGKDNGFRVINLAPVFQKEAEYQSNLLYYPMDGHFTPLGHKVFAEALKEEISDYITHDR